MTNPKFSVTSDSGRYYTIPDYKGMTFYSVTTALNAIAKPALMKWSAKMVAEKAIDLADRFAPVMSKADVEKLLKDLKAAPQEYTKAAQERGTAVHKLCEGLIKGGVILPLREAEFMPYVDQFQKFFEENDVEFLASEMTVFNPEFLYAGTLDAIVTMDGKNYVMDIKTGGVYPSASLQMCAYARATHALDADGVAREQNIPIDGAFVLELKPNSYKIHFMDIGDAQFEVFKNVLAVSIWNNETSRKVIGNEFR